MWRAVNGMQDFPKVFKALESTKEFILNNYSNKSWFSKLNYDVILDNIFSGKMDVAIIDESYLLVYDISTPWFSEELLMTELFLLRIGGDAKFSDAVSGMESIAKFYGAKSIASGTALTTNDEALARLYKKNGFDVACIQLHKEI